MYELSFDCHNSLNEGGIYYNPVLDGESELYLFREVMLYKSHWEGKSQQCRFAAM